MKDFIKRHKFLIFWLLISLLYCCTVVTTEMSSIPLGSWKAIILTAMQWGLITFCTSGLLLLLCLSRWVFAIVWPLLLTFSWAICFYVITIGQTFTAVSIEIALVNNADMWLSVISPWLVITMVLALAIGVVTAVYRWKYIHPGRRTRYVGLAAGVIMGSMPFLMPRFYGPVGSRLPYSLYFATRTYYENRANISEHRNTYLHTPAQADANAPDLFFVLGESLRADHLPQNGYTRNTMPQLSADSTVISYPNIYSEYVQTHLSLPHLLTSFSMEYPDTAYRSQSFIPLFKKAGYKSAWFANQDISETYAYFTRECDTISYCNAARSRFSYTKWLDNDVIPNIKRWLQEADGFPRLAIIHSAGSHWWYNSHYEQKHALFLPDADSKELSALSLEQIINSYDNSIVATDDFLAQLIQLVSDRNAVIIFISDHGESLGENGKFLHGTDNEALHYPACLFWISPKYAATFPKKAAKLTKNRLRRAETDAFFHTALDLGAINTPALNPTKSLLHE